MKYTKFLVLPAAAITLVGGGLLTASAASTHLNNVVWNKTMGKHAVHYSNHYSVLWNSPASTSKSAHRTHYLKNYKHTTFYTKRHMKVTNGKIYYYIKSGKVAGWINKKYVALGNAKPKVINNTINVPVDNPSTATTTPSKPTIIYVPTNNGTTSSNSSNTSSNSNNNQNNASAQQEAQTAANISAAKKQGIQDSKFIKPEDLTKEGIGKSQTIKNINDKAADIKKSSGEDAANAYLNSVELGAVLSQSPSEMKKIIDNADINKVTVTEADLNDAITNGASQASVNTLKNLLKTPEQITSQALNDINNIDTSNLADPSVKAQINALGQKSIIYNSNTATAYNDAMELSVMLKTMSANEVANAMKSVASDAGKTATYTAALQQAAKQNFEAEKANQVLLLIK